MKLGCSVRIVLVAWVYGAAALQAAENDPDTGVIASPSAGTLILDETAYCRAYYHFDVQRIAAGPLKSEGAKLLSPIMMSRLEKEVHKRLASKNLDWDKEDWRDYVTVEAEYNSFARKNRVFIRLGSITEPPADDWRGFEFDDSAWPRLRKPDGVGSPAQYTVGTPERNGWLRGVFLRFRFELPDPATVGAVTLSADYIGGMRAFVNGQEIARGHLPAGPLDAETMAVEYPLDAYVAMYADLPAKEKEKYHGRSLAPAQVIRSADELTPLGSRLYKIRNRTVAPLTIPPQLLRKGTNVLAIELRAAPLHPYVMKEWFGYRDVVDRQWEHARLSHLELRCASPDVPSGLRRPKGVQIWTEDMTRRMFSPEYLEPGASTGAGPPGGSAKRNLFGAGACRNGPGTCRCEGHGLGSPQRRGRHAAGRVRNYLRDEPPIACRPQFAGGRTHRREARCLRSAAVIPATAIGARRRPVRWSVSRPKRWTTAMRP